MIISCFAIASCDKADKDNISNNEGDPEYTLPDFKKMTSECSTLDEVIAYLQNEGYSAQYYYGTSAFNVVEATKFDGTYDITINVGLNPLISFEGMFMPTESELATEIKKLYPTDKYDTKAVEIIEVNGFDIYYSVVKRLPSEVVYENATTICATYENAEKIDEYLVQKGYFKTVVTQEDVEDAESRDPKLTEYGYIASNDRLYIKRESEYLFSVIELYVNSENVFSEEKHVEHIPSDIVKAKIDAILAHNGASPDSHTYTASETPVCGANGCLDDYYTLSTCICGKKEVDLEENRIYVSAKSEHSFKEEITKRATCKSSGILTKTCTTCNYQVETNIPIDPNSHIYSYSIDVEVEPTCTTDGYGTYHCSKCHQSITGVIKGEHIFSRCSHTEISDTNLFVSSTCYRCNYNSGSVNVATFTYFDSTIPSFDIGDFAGGKTTVIISGKYNSSFEFAEGIFITAYTLALEHTIELEGDYTDKSDNSVSGILGGSGNIVVGGGSGNLGGGSGNIIIGGGSNNSSTNTNTNSSSSSSTVNSDGSVTLPDDEFED